MIEIGIETNGGSDLHGEETEDGTDLGDAKKDAILPIIKHPKFPAIYLAVDREGKRLATLSLAPKMNVYGEETFHENGLEYRVWDPYRSKLGAAILKGLVDNPVRPGARVLYLGAASGTTVSHVSDVVGETGIVYCVEFAQRSFRDLVENVCKYRSNTVPIFEDARFPGKYRSIVSGVDTVYCDIAQQDQTRILLENAKMYMDDKGSYLLVVKSRSIDVSRDPGDVFRSEMGYLERNGYTVDEKIRLEPFEKDHAMFRGARRKRSG